ncbi:hypothetical protein ISCGN_020957 [Ixodes scapularis]
MKDNILELACQNKKLSNLSDILGFRLPARDGTCRCATPILAHHRSINSTLISFQARCMDKLFPQRFRFPIEVSLFAGLCILQRAAIGLSSHLDNFSVAVPS